MKFNLNELVVITQDGKDEVTGSQHKFNVGDLVRVIRVDNPPNDNEEFLCELVFTTVKGTYNDTWWIGRTEAELHCPLVEIIE